MKKPRAPLALVPKVAPPALPARDQALLAEMLDAYHARQVGSRRHEQKSYARDLGILQDFLRFSGAPPWRWSEQNFDAWCRHLGLERELAPSSQRLYQSAVHGFLQFLIDNVKFRNEVRRLYGIDLVQICTEENRIPHVTDRELSKERRAMTHEEINSFFRATDAAIGEAHRFGSKSFRPLQRDKALFFMIYVAGLRISEALGLKTHSFYPNPQLPELGDFGFVSVMGKGSHGSGPRYRSVPIDHIGLPPMLRWYMDKVRPYFLVNADANEDALFLSERGRRLAISTLEARFQALIELAGLSGLNLTPHCLRHSSVTHGTMAAMSVEAMRRKHGHAFSATTQVYTHFPDEFVGQEVTRFVERQFDDALKKKDDI